MRKSTPYFLILVVACAILFVGYMGVNYFTGQDNDDLGYQSLGVYTIGTGTTSPQLLEMTTSSTTDAYETSVSKTFRVDNVSEIDMNLDLMASTSGVMTWVYYFSDNGGEWYAEDGNSDTSDVVMTHGATAYAHTWTPGVTTHAYKHVSVLDSSDNINSKYFRVTFTPTTASSSLYVEITTKQK